MENAADVDVLLVGRFATDVARMAGEIDLAGFQLRVASADLDWPPVEPEPTLVLVCEVAAECRSALLCKSVRATSDVPIIVIGDGGNEDSVLCLYESGADVVMSTPLRLRELVARMRAVLRRRPPPRPVGSADVLTVGGVELDVQGRRLRVGDDVTILAPKEAEILELLMRNAGRTMPRTTLVHTVWGAMSTSASMSLDVHIRRLRAHLEAGGGPRVIKTVRGVGFRFDV